jgi:peptide/nickel transport system ATP-binding protein
LALLEVKSLKIAFELTGGKRLNAVNGLGFTLNEGETLALVGESGSGKTTAALSLMRLLPKNAVIDGGEILYKEKNVLSAPDHMLQKLRWKEIAMIFQGAMNALNPVLTIEEQMVEAILLHETISNEAAYARAEMLMRRVEIDPKRLKQYPHQFSGGMRQRVMIAMALACEPKIVIGDEPTTALDVMVQAQIFELLESLKKEMGLSMILITHDLSILGDICDKVAVMYAGEIVESGTVEAIYAHAQHPYTQKLLAAYPIIGKKRGLPAFIPGQPLDMTKPVTGCAFYGRCHKAMPVCLTKPPLRTVDSSHQYLCHLEGDSACAR